MLWSWWTRQVCLLLNLYRSLLLLQRLRSLNSWFCNRRLSRSHRWNRLGLYIVQWILSQARIIIHRKKVGQSLSIYSFLVDFAWLVLFFDWSFFTREVFGWADLELWYWVVKVVLQVWTCDWYISHWLLKRRSWTSTTACATNCRLSLVLVSIFGSWWWICPSLLRRWPD